MEEWACLLSHCLEVLYKTILDKKKIKNTYEKLENQTKPHFIVSALSLNSTTFVSQSLWLKHDVQLKHVNDTFSFMCPELLF